MKKITGWFFFFLIACVSFLRYAKITSAMGGKFKADLGVKICEFLILTALLLNSSTFYSKMTIPRAQYLSTFELLSPLFRRDWIHMT